jgi:hypothetical protein
MTKFAWLPISVLVAGCSGESAGEIQREKQSIELDGSESTRVTLTMEAGELKVSGGAMTLMDAEFAYNIDRLKPVVEHHAGEIEISQTGTRGFALGNTVSRWDLRLNNGVGWDVIAKLGAGEADLNLGDLNLRNVEMSIGAGEVRVDLRGTPKRSYNVRVQGGVGETVVHLPRTVGITASAAGGIGSISVNGLEKRGERWINAGHEGDAVQITVDVKGGIGEIQVNAQ